MMLMAEQSIYDRLVYNNKTETPQGTLRKESNRLISWHHLIFWQRVQKSKTDVVVSSISFGAGIEIFPRLEM